MAYNFTEYEKATLNALENIMSELSIISSLMASSHGDKNIRDKGRSFLDIVFARSRLQTGTLGQSLEPLSKEKKE